MSDEQTKDKFAKIMSVIGRYFDIRTQSLEIKMSESIDKPIVIKIGGKEISKPMIEKITTELNNVGIATHFIDILGINKER